jgi:hypothetical protein
VPEGLWSTEGASNCSSSCRVILSVASIHDEPTFAQAVGEKNFH